MGNFFLWFAPEKQDEEKESIHSNDDLLEEFEPKKQPGCSPWIGKTFTEIKDEIPPDTVVRVVVIGSPIIADYMPDRVNISTNKRGTIVSVTYG